MRVPDAEDEPLLLLAVPVGHDRHDARPAGRLESAAEELKQTWLRLRKGHVFAQFVHIKFASPQAAQLSIFYRKISNVAHTRGT